MRAGGDWRTLAKTTGATRSTLGMAGLLDVQLLAREWLHQRAVQGEREVDGPDHDEDDVTEDYDAILVQLRDAQHGRNLLPAQARVSHEDANAHQVEHDPNRVAEDFE